MKNIDYLRYIRTDTNYLTYTGKFGDNDINKLLDNKNIQICGPVTLEKYLHGITLDIVVRSIEACVLWKPEFSDTKWYSDLHNRFGIRMDIFTPINFLVLKHKLSECWGIQRLYNFLKDNYTTNIMFNMDFGKNGKKQVAVNKFCSNADPDADEIHFSLISFINEYID